MLLWLVILLSNECEFVLDLIIVIVDFDFSISILCGSIILHLYIDVIIFLLVYRVSLQDVLIFFMWRQLFILCVLPKQKSDNCLRWCLEFV